MVSKTVELRKIVEMLLKEVNNNVYYVEATNKSPFPYIVFDFNTVDLNNYPREDVFLVVDVWDKSDDTMIIENLADDIEKKLNRLNYPTATVLPTFFLSTRYNLSDENKLLKRRQLRFEIQNYERS